MQRTVKRVAQRVEPIVVPSDFERDSVGWLTRVAVEHDLRWLLAHADDGVIWGYLADQTLRLSGEVFPEVSPPLRTITLQQARLFGERGELLLWREADGWRARLIEEGDGPVAESFDEQHLLWGTHREAARDGFSLLREGAEGLRHTPPIAVETNGDGELIRRVALVLRHTIGYDDDGQAGLVRSRLVALQVAESRGGG